MGKSFEAIPKNSEYRCEYKSVRMYLKQVLLGATLLYYPLIGLY